MSVYNTDGPECPKCGTIWKPDDSYYYDERGFDLECYECETKFSVRPAVYWSWTTKEIKQ